MDNLKIELSKKVGFVITNKPDCARVSELISQSGFGYISETTLYRMIFQPKNHKPYKTTLDILCKFIGFKDSIHFQENIDNLGESLLLNGFNTKKSDYNNLIYHCLENEAHKPLEDFFSSLEERTEEYRIWVNIALFDGLMNSNKQESFFKKLAHHKFIREYIFERGHDPKFRIKNYDTGYLYYIKNKINENNTTEFQDYIFGNCVLFRYYYLTKDYKNALIIGRKLYKHFSKMELDAKHIHLFPYTRYQAYRLWYLQLINSDYLDIEDYGFRLINNLKGIHNEYDSNESNIVLHTIIETFIFSKLSENLQAELRKVCATQKVNLDFTNKKYTLLSNLRYIEPNGLMYYRPA